MTDVVRREEVEALLREIQRYLAYVEAFRTAARRPPPAESKGGKT